MSADGPDLAAVFVDRILARARDGTPAPPDVEDSADLDARPRARARRGKRGGRRRSGKSAREWKADRYVRRALDNVHRRSPAERAVPFRIATIRDLAKLLREPPPRGELVEWSYLLQDALKDIEQMADSLLRDLYPEGVARE